MWPTHENKKHKEKLVMFTNQPEDSERCESIELDNKIRDLIERNPSPPPTAFTPGTPPSNQYSRSLKDVDLSEGTPKPSWILESNASISLLSQASLPNSSLLFRLFMKQSLTKSQTQEGNSTCEDMKTPGKTTSMAHCVQDTSTANAAESSTELAENAQLSRMKNLINAREERIRCLEKQREELLDVNKQWDKQFRSMKELYKKEMAKLKEKVDASGRCLSPAEKEQLPGTRDSDWQRDLALELLHRKEKEKESLNEELQELKKENKLLREKNTLANKKKDHYEREIKRLNKALQDALKIECSSFPENCLGTPEWQCSHEELRTEMEVLKQQVQIYEEDFKEERSDRERLHQEKEELQQKNQTSQSQLNRLNSKIKACQMEKEKLEKQLKQRYLPPCHCSLQRCLPPCHCVVDFYELRGPSTPATDPGTAQEPRKRRPGYQWYAPDLLPPDVQHKANGFSSEKKASQ